MNKLDKIREEFIIKADTWPRRYDDCAKFLNSDENLLFDTNNYPESQVELDPEKVADFFLSRFQKMLEELEGEIKKGKMGYFLPEPIGTETLEGVIPERIGAMSYNQALEDSANIIRKYRKQ
jgi:hypothetical protein